MRPLAHPRLEDIRVENIMHALSDPARLRIFAGLSRSDCTMNCASFATMDELSLSKSTLSQHFKVLREAGLIESARKGVELLNRTRDAELQAKFGDLICRIVSAYLEQDTGKPAQ